MISNYLIGHCANCFPVRLRCIYLWLIILKSLIYLRPLFIRRHQVKSRAGIPEFRRPKDKNGPGEYPLCLSAAVARDAVSLWYRDGSDEGFPAKARVFISRQLTYPYRLFRQASFRRKA